jgi:ribonuclease P protein component
MLARESRIAADKDIKRILKLGKRFSCPECVLYFVPNPLGFPRVGFVVASGVSKRAVVRNRIKRQAREVVRLAIEQKLLTHSIDIIIMLRPAAAKIADDVRREFFREFFERIGIIPKSKKHV